MPNIWGVLFALFLIAHGLLHLLYVTPRPEGAKGWPFELGRSWVWGGTGAAASGLRTLGKALVTVTVIAFVLAGLGVFGVPGLVGLWPWTTVIAATVSLLLLGLFFHSQLIVGIFIDAGLLVVVFAFLGPTSALLGI